MTSATSAWRNRDFVKLWAAQATGLIGQQFSVLAVPMVAILTLEVSAPTVALLVACFNLPSVLFGLFVGVLIDRTRRRTVLIVTDIGRALLFASIPVAYVAGALSIQQMFGLAVLIGILDLGWMTAYRSYVPAVVDRRHLSQAYAMVGASDAVTRTAAPSLAGGVIQVLGAPFGVGVTSVVYLVSAACNSRIRRREPRPDPDDHDPVLRSFVDGVVYLWRHRIVRAFVCSDAGYVFFWSATQSVLLVFLSRHLGLSAGTIGVIFTVGTVGGLLAAVLARRIGLLLRPGPTILVGSLLRGLGMALLPLAVLLGPLAIGALMLARLVNSFGWTLWDVHSETVKQHLLPDRVRGRVNGSTFFLSGIGLTFGAAAGALLVGLVGVIGALLVGCLGTLIATAWLLPIKVWRLAEVPEVTEDPSR